MLLKTVLIELLNDTNFNKLSDFNATSKRRLFVLELMMESSQQLNEQINADRPEFTNDELHAYARQYINESNQLIFHKLPDVLAQIIERDVWLKRPQAYKNFGEYALNQSDDGLAIANNDMLWLLKSAIKTKSQYAAQWGDVLVEVETNVRTYAKEKNIPIKELKGNLAEQELNHPELVEENVITYLPSRSNSSDGQLLKLKKNDPKAYTEVVQGKINLKQALPQTPRKKVLPIESVKNKFTSLSQADRDAFLAWIHQEHVNHS